MTKDKKTDHNISHSFPVDTHEHDKDVINATKNKKHDHTHDAGHRHDDHHGHDHDHSHHDHSHHGHDHSHDNHSHSHDHNHDHDHKHDNKVVPISKEEKQARKGKNKKSATESKVGAKRAFATLKMLRVSPRKLGLVAGLIRGKHVNEALEQLTFSNKRIAKAVKELLRSAIANAENNHNLNIDYLYVDKVIVGKGIVMKRIHTRARGRAFRVRKYFSNITIEVVELNPNLLKQAV
jgi:large subunit ribosomal protein L22